jgi:hypothetical protein
MKKHGIRNVLALALILLCVIQAYASDLYNCSVNKENVCGKPLIMEFEELERADNYSVCKIKHEKGAAFASIAFEVHCYCEIAKLRNALFFAQIENSERENDSWTTKIAFWDSKDIDLKKLYGKEIKSDEITSIEDCKYW